MSASVDTTVTAIPAKSSGLSLAAKLALCALFVQAWLVLLHFRLAGHENPNVRVVGLAFDLTREATIPNAFAAVQALVAGLLAGALASIIRKDHGDRRRWLGWLSVTAVFFVIAIDDAASLHERVNAIVSLDLIAPLNYPSYPWHVILFPCFALGLGVTLWVVRADLTKTFYQKLALIVGLLSFALSQSFDFVEGWEIMTQTPNTPISAQIMHMMVVEEVLEMFGTTLFIYVFLTALLSEVSQRHPEWTASTKNQPNTL